MENGDKRRTVWINIKISGSAVEKCLNFFYTKETVPTISGRFGTDDGTKIHVLEMTGCEIITEENGETDRGRRILYRSQTAGGDRAAASGAADRPVCVVAGDGACIFREGAEHLQRGMSALRDQLVLPAGRRDSRGLSGALQCVFGSLCIYDDRGSGGYGESGGDVSNARRARGSHEGDSKDSADKI